MRKVNHQSLLGEGLLTMFKDMKKGDYFYPIFRQEDIKHWRTRACSAGRAGNRAYRVMKDNKGSFYIARIA